MGVRQRCLAAGELVVDLARHEVRLADSILKLEPHPMDLLILLMEREGELVTRRDIAQRLWPSGTHVVVDEGINTVVRKLRKSLADDPRHPRYVGTVVRKGYRFLAVVERRGVDSVMQSLPTGRIVWEERSVTLTNGDNVIGRDPAAAVCIDSHTVSRRHAVVRVDADSAVLEDLRSKNGTKVNGVSVDAPVVLSDGDRIEVGGVRIVFVRPSHSSRTRTLAPS
jgi:DNA-binding winged helix-turn-helix (wHTH) protein